MSEGERSMLRRPCREVALRPLPRLVALAVLFATAACREEAPPPHLRLPGAEAGRGRTVIVERGCGACHVIPGIPGAVAWVGPPLMEWSRRGYVGGRLPNAPENLVAWLRDPQAISPGSAMPSLGLSEGEARDAAAYLYTLGRAQPVPAGMMLGPRDGGPRPEARLRNRGAP